MLLLLEFRSELDDLKMTEDRKSLRRRRREGRMIDQLNETLVPSKLS